MVYLISGLPRHDSGCQLIFQTGVTKTGVTIDSFSWRIPKNARYPMSFFFELLFYDLRTISRQPQAKNIVWQ